MKTLKLSITTKLVLGTLVLVILAILPVAYVTSTYFESVSRKKEVDINLSDSVARATDTENILQALLEKSRSMGSLYLMKNADANSTIEPLLENDRDIFAVDVYRAEDGEFKLEKSLIKRKQFKRMGVDESLLERIRLKNPFPISSVAQGQIEIMPVTNESETPLMAFGVPLTRNELGQIDTLTVTYFELSRLQRAFIDRGDRLTFLVDARGQILAHPSEALVLKGESLKDHPVVANALADPSPRAQISFTDPATHVAMQGAFVRTAMGPIVVSEVSEASIQAPAVQATRQAIYIAGLVLSAAVFVVFLFSITISSPIESLADFVREVQKGNLDVSTAGKVKSRDEVGELAREFDRMVGGLRERAKAYSVMRQALGSSVVETLMQMKDEELGGQKKQVAVLFSDLRDFTKFSEGHAPEEVVTMLNEYFDVMVKVIERNGGWLDKFIGDAIMAVWGVPYTGENDEGRAARAAIDMRLALGDLNRDRLLRGQSPIKIGIGLHCGEAIVGKIGATERANLTVIGDTVNQASRIEASTKAFGADILMSEEMAKKLETQFVLEYAGAAEVKGKADALKLYKIRGYTNDDGEDVEVITQWTDFAKADADKVKVS